MSLVAFILILCILAAPAVSKAQPAGKVWRIGYLSPDAAASDSSLPVLRQGLQELGYIEGQNLFIEYRHAQGAVRWLPELASELVQLKVDVIVTYGTPAIQAAKDATKAVPIVMAAVADPVAVDLVSSLARPGGNVTVLTLLSPELSGKRLELLKEVAPRIARVAVVGNATSPVTTTLLFKEAEVAARSLGMQLKLVEATGPDDLDRTFSAIAEWRADAVFVLHDPMLRANSRRLADLASKARLPSMADITEFAKVGGLMAYGATLSDRFHHAATYIDKILKGAKPANLPVEQPTKFEFVFNLKAAKALGLTIPQSVLLRADEVIQ